MPVSAPVCTPKTEGNAVHTRTRSAYPQTPECRAVAAGMHGPVLTWPVVHLQAGFWQRGRNYGNSGSAESVAGAVQALSAGVHA